MDDSNVRLRRVAQLVFRGFSTAAALLAVAQPVLAGGFLQGHYGLLHAHEVAAMILAAAVLSALVSAVLMWRPGRSAAGREAVLLTLAAFLAVAVQIMLGFSRVLIIHIPLGIGVLALVGRMAALAWRTPLGAAAGTAVGASGPDGEAVDGPGTGARSAEVGA